MRMLRSIAAAVALAGFGLTAYASEVFPTRPVRILVPYAPGGATDTSARPLADKLRERWGQPVIIDNRPGASGNIAIELVATAAPDGHTLFVGNVSTNAINESIFKTKYAPSRDLMGITNLIELPHVWAVHPSIAASGLKDFVEYVRKSPKPLNYASAGIGSYPHLDVLVFLRHTGLNMTHVPYKGGAGQMVPSVLSNETQFMFVNLGSTLAHIRSGRLKALATSWPTRRPEIPEVPTVAEAGFPGMGTNAWNGIFAPARIPPALLARLHKDIVAAMDTQEMKDLLAKSTMSVVLNKSPAEYQKFVTEQAAKWRKVVTENNVKVE